MNNWKEMLEVSLKAARTIAQKAQSEGRNLTDAEEATFNGHMAKAAEARAKLKEIEESDKVFEQLCKMGPSRDRSTAKAGDVLSFKGLDRQLKGRMNDRGGFNVKSLLSAGTQVTPAQTLTSPVTLAKPATSLLDLLPVRILAEGAEYSYLTQTTRTNNAAPVADGALKPTSVYAMERVSRSLEVIAHLSEPIPEYWLKDSKDLGEFIASELGYGLQLAVENQAMNGNGTSPNLLGLLAASGIQAQVFNTTQILTVRSAITKVEILGYTASGLVLHPSDWEAIETAADGEDRFFMTPGSNPVDRAARRLWSVPVALSTQVAEGSGVLLSDGAAGLVTDGRVEFEMARVGDDFERNQVRARVEGRFGVEVFRPTGIVEIDLTAA